MGHVQVRKVLVYQMVDGVINQQTSARGPSCILVFPLNDFLLTEPMYIPGGQAEASHLASYYSQLAEEPWEGLGVMIVHLAIEKNVHRNM